MAKLMRPRTSQSSHLRHVSSGSSATKQNNGDNANEFVRETGPGSSHTEGHEFAPVRRLFVLSIHDETFSRDDVVLNISNEASIPIGCLLRLTPLKGGTAILHASVSDEDIDLDKQYIFIFKALGHDLLSKQPDLQVSLLQSIAWKFGIQKGTQVLVSTADEASCSASHVEVVFRDQYLARADMWRLISAELANTCIFRGQTIVFMGTIKATIKTIYVEGKKLPSALFHCSTKPIFRSESARYVLFIQMSKEMWDFDAEGSGEIMFDKVINGFLPELFRRWQELKVRHLVSIVLFTRMVYEDGRDEGLIKTQKTLAGAIGTSRDFYRVVVSDMASGEWATILAQLKQEFLVFLRDISIQKPAIGDHLPLDAGVSLTSTQLPNHAIAGHPSAATHGNVLEAINLASSQFSTDYIDRDLDRTGVSIVVISPSAGLFEVENDLLVATTENLIDNGVGIDLVCLSKMPLHSVPLFKYRAPQSMFEDAALVSLRTTEGEEKTLKGSFSNSMVTGASLKTYTYDKAPPKEAEAESDSKVLEWSYGIPHWVDISFWDSLPDESGGSKSSAIRRKLKYKSSFDAPQHKAFIPRVRMYELQMMGVMENAISDISIPQLSRPSASPAAISQAFESAAFTESSRRDSSAQSPYGSFRTSHSMSLDQTSKHSTSPRSNRPSEKRSIGLLYDWMDEYDDLVFRHPLAARKRPRRTKASKSASRDRQSRNNSLSLRSTSTSTQHISSSHLKHSFDRDSFLSQIMLERHASQKKDASRGRLGSRSSSIKSTGPRPNLTSHQISFGPRGLGASASKAVASTELSIDHGAASLSRGLKWRPPNVLTDHNSTVPPHAIGNKLPDRLSPEISDKRGSDLAISSESESQRFSRPIPIRNTTAVRITEGKTSQSRSQGYIGHPSGVELHERLSELQDLRDVEQYAPTLEAQDLGDAEPVQTSLSPNTTLAPWLTILNPSNPSKTKNSLASRLGRWHHIFPRPLRTSQIKWKSLCSPAAVPLTTEDIPTTEQLLEEYQASVYSVDLPEKVDLAENPRSLITELIAFRLSRGFQIVVGERLSKSVKVPALFSKPFDVFDEQVLTEDCSTIVLSRGSTIHQIRRLSDSKIEVKQLVRHKNVATNPHTEAEPAVYKPSIRSMLTEKYEIQEVSIAPQRADFNWKVIDSYIVGNERPKAKDFVDNLRPWRARYVLIPVETPRSVRRPHNSINEDDEEEVRLEGIRKLSQVWQRFRYVPPDERRFQPPSRNRKDTNPLDIMYQTRDPSAIVAAELENVAEGDASGRPVQLLPESDLYQRSTFKLSALAETIQEETKGVRMRDRRWHFRLHYNCFIGEELTTWLKNNFRDVETRDEAVELGKDLMRSGLFKHVEGRHDFRDGNYFYQIADEYRAPRPEPRGWFGRSKASVPSTPVSECLPQNPPMTSRSRASSGSAGTSADASEPTTPTGNKQKLGVALSKSLLYDVDHRKRSYRSELINLHYDRLHNPDNCYHIRIEWMNTTPKLIKDTITSWATSVDRFGLRLVEVPIGEASSITSMHPFRSPYRIELKTQPPAKQPLSYFDSTNFSPQQIHRKHYYQKALLKIFEFVLDFEAASDFPPDVDVTYSWGKPDYKYPQYIHRSGRLIVQITDEGDFLLLANRLYNDHGASAKSAYQEVAKSDNPSDGEGHRGPGFFRSNPHGGNVGNLRGSPRLSPYSSPSMRATLDIPSSTPNTTRGPSPVSNPVQLQSSPKPKSSSTRAETLKQEFEAFCNDKEALDIFYEETLSKASTPGPNTPFLGGKTPSRGPMTPSGAPEKLSMESSIPSLALPETLVSKRTRREGAQWKGEED